MALKAIVDTLDGLPAEIAAEYSEKDDGKGGKRYVLDLVSIETHPGALALKNALDRVKADRTAAENKLADLETRFEGLPEDFDATHYEALKEAADKGTKPMPQAELDALLASRVAAATKRADEKAAKAEKQLGEVKARFFNSEKTRVINDALDEAGIKDAIPRKAARGILAPLAEVVEGDTGEPAVVYRDTELGVTTPFGAFVDTWKGSDEGKYFVAPRDNEGGGATGNGNGNGGDPLLGGWTKDNFNATRFGQLRKRSPLEANRVARKLGMLDLVDDDI